MLIVVSATFFFGGPLKTRNLQVTLGVYLFSDDIYKYVTNFRHLAGPREKLAEASIKI